MKLASVIASIYALREALSPHNGSTPAFVVTLPYGTFRELAGDMRRDLDFKSDQPMQLWHMPDELMLAGVLFQCAPAPEQKSMTMKERRELME